MTQIIVAPIGSIDNETKEKLDTKGIILIETNEPESIKILSIFEQVSGDEFLDILLTEINNPQIAQVETVKKRVAEKMFSKILNNNKKIVNK